MTPRRNRHDPPARGARRTGPILAALLAGLHLAAAPGAGADRPDAATLLQDLGYSSDDVARVMAGEIVRGNIESSSERELAVALAFMVPVAPSALVDDLKAGMLNTIDSQVNAWGTLQGDGTPADLEKLVLTSNRAGAYAAATAGESLNLSAAEIAALKTIPAGDTAAIAQQVRKALLARLQAYRTKGFLGVAPYARADGQERSPAEELRSATLKSKALQKYVPTIFGMLQSYPRNKPAGTDEVFRWSSLTAHGEPTLVLTHALFAAEGAAYVVVQRQFYVSAGYNAEQAVVAFVPVAAGTVVAYSNRTSTDQVEGFGGGTKRTIGSKVMAAQLETIFTKFRAAAEKGGS